MINRAFAPTFSSTDWSFPDMSLSTFFDTRHWINASFAVAAIGLTAACSDAAQPDETTTQSAKTQTTELAIDAPVVTYRDNAGQASPDYYWAAGEPGLFATIYTSVNQSPDGQVILTRLAEERSSGGRTSGAYLEITGADEQAFSGQTIDISVKLQGPSGSDVDVAYSTADNGNSDWKTFELTGEPQWVEFSYDVPAIVAGNNDYLGVLPAMGSAVTLYSVRIFIRPQT